VTGCRIEDANAILSKITDFPLRHYKDSETFPFSRPVIKWVGYLFLCNVKNGFIYGLFKDALSSSDYVALNGNGKVVPVLN
jgi:hypothetical protein